MPFDFSCTHCGKHLTQANVLFEMSSLFLRGDRSSFHYLTMRLLPEEIENILARGEHAYGYQDRYECCLSFSSVMDLMGNQRNLNVPAFQELTLEDVTYFLENRNKSFVIPKKNDDISDSVPSPDLDYLEEQSPDESQTDSAEEIIARKREHDEKMKPFHAVLTRQSEEQSAVDLSERETRLAGDLEQLCASFRSEDGMFRVVLEPIYDTTVEQESILTGWKAYRIAGNGNLVPVARQKDSRLCPECLEKIFAAAGTAVHRTVVFIGSHGTGKTSAILAASHLLNYCGEDEEESSIWNGVKLYNFRQRDMCSPSKQMIEEFEGYGHALAPAKTDTIRVGASSEMHKAYSSTFRLVDRNGTTTLLSLLDAPGEICKETTGSIDEEMIEKHFNIILTSDAYVLCFEHPKGEEERKKREALIEKLKSESGEAINRASSNGEDVAIPMTPAKKVCNWADQIQKMRRKKLHNEGKEAGNIPMLLLFTKCPKLESDDELDESQYRPHKSDLYLFPKERQAIQEEKSFQKLIKLLSEHSSMKESYCAQLRCSPYGFQSESKDDRRYLQDTETIHKTELRPAPQNVDKLVEWILYVTGTIPVDLSYISLGSAYVKPPENRHLLPYDKYLLDGGREIVLDWRFWKWAKERPYMNVVRVAALRCRLFDNARPMDRDLVRFHDDPTQMRTIWKKLEAVRQKGR